MHIIISDIKGKVNCPIRNYYGGGPREVVQIQNPWEGQGRLQKGSSILAETWKKSESQNEDKSNHMEGISQKGERTYILKKGENGLWQGRTTAQLEETVVQDEERNIGKGTRA